MNLTIIVPNCRDREMLHRIAKSGLGKDEIIRLKVTSRTVKVVLDKAIENAIYDDILIVNPKNIKIQTKNNSIDIFRDNGLIFTDMRDNAVSSISSIKFNKKHFTFTNNNNIKNIYEYIKDLADEMSDNETKNFTTSKKPKTIEKNPSKLSKKFNNRKPKILFICDVKD